MCHLHNRDVINPDPHSTGLRHARVPCFSHYPELRNGLPIVDPQPVIRRILSCIGYSAVVTWRSRADAPFVDTYVDAAPFCLDLAGNRTPTQSSRLDELASLSVARGPRP